MKSELIIYEMRIRFFFFHYEAHRSVGLEIRIYIKNSQKET